MRRAILGLMLGSMAALSGCSNPCQKLADLACERSGQDSKACKEARARAEKTVAEERELCATALELYSLAVEKR